MKKLAFALAFALPMALSATADAGRSYASDCARAKKAGKACVIDFGKGDSFTGARISPDGDGITANTGAKFGTLLKYRLHWHDQIVRSVNRL